MKLVLNQEEIKEAVKFYVKHGIKAPWKVASCNLRNKSTAPYNLEADIRFEDETFDEEQISGALSLIDKKG